MTPRGQVWNIMDSTDTGDCSKAWGQFEFWQAVPRFPGLGSRHRQDTTLWFHPPCQSVELDLIPIRSHPTKPELNPARPTQSCSTLSSRFLTLHSCLNHRKLLSFNFTSQHSLDDNQTLCRGMITSVHLVKPVAMWQAAVRGVRGQGADRRDAGPHL